MAAKGPGPDRRTHHCHRDGHDTGTVTVTVSGPTQTPAPGVAGPVRVTDGPGLRIACGWNASTEWPGRFSVSDESEYTRFL